MADITEYDIQIKFKQSGAEKTASDVNKVQSSMDKLKSTIKGLGIGVALKKATDAIGGFINKTSDYIETMNLFRASMGSAADKAEEFVNKAEKALGLDPKALMDSISSFQNLSESIGVSSDRAYIMSQNLTQLAGDLSSFANISFEQAQRKLLSGFSGQVKPLREYGIALNQASLQETAYSLGIQQKIKDMTMAQKTELIYYQIMTSTQKMQGDLGRSLISPANALRVMKNEFQRLARAVGSIFIPIMMKIIPVVRAVTEILISAAQAIAKFFGFEMSDFNADLSSVGNLLEGVSDDIGGIGDSAEDTTKKLNKMLMPFDELNNISTSAAKNAGAGGIGAGGGSLGIDLPEYDMFNSISDGMSEKVEKIKEIIKGMLPVIGTIGAAFATWKISNGVINALDKIFNFTKEVKSSALKIALGLTLAISGIKIVFGSIEKMLNGDLSVQNLLLGLFGAGAAGLGGGLIASGLGLASAGPIGWTIGIALALVVALTWAFKKDEELYTQIASAQGLDYNEMGFWDKQKLHITTTLEILGLKETDGDTPWGQAVDRFHEEFKAKINGVFESIGKFFSEKIPEVFVKSGENVGIALGTIWEKIKTFFEESPAKVKLAIDTILPKIGNFFKELPGKIWKFFTEDEPKFQENVFNWGKNIVIGLWNGVTSLNDWLNEKIANWLVNFIKGFKEGLGIHSPSTVFKEIGENLIKGLTNGISNMWHTLTEKFDNIKNLTNFDWRLPSLRVPKIYWTTQQAPDWIANILKAINLPAQVPKLNVSWYANGGFPDVGQLFVANEAGPELVGNIGNRTAVANQNQIVEAVSKGVYDAVVSANSGNSNTSPYIVVNLGNENLYKGFGQHKREQANMYGISV